MTEAIEQRLPLGALLDPRCARAGAVCADDADAIRQAAALLADVEAATPGYAEAAIARERVYPTGLETRPVGVALPHADEGVLRPALALLTLRDPVVFRGMGTEDTPVQVQIVVLLGLPAGDAHVQAMGALADLIQQPSRLEELLRADTSDALYAVFQRVTASPGVPGAGE